MNGPVYPSLLGPAADRALDPEFGPVLHSVLSLAVPLGHSSPSGSPGVTDSLH